MFSRTHPINIGVSRCGNSESRERREMNSRDKGKRGEREVAQLFKKVGYPAERGQQHDGMTGHADVVGVPYIWIEVKLREKLDLEEAMKQAERDCTAFNAGHIGDESLPAVFHRRNREKWKVTMRLLDLIYLCGSMPFSVCVPVHGLVTMSWEDWIQVFVSYDADRRAG